MVTTFYEKTSRGSNTQNKASVTHGLYKSTLVLCILRYYISYM
jgi:hypothetical protein